MKRLRFWIPFLLGTVAFGSVALTLRDPGLTWDESIHFGFSHRYWILAYELGRQDWYDLPELPNALRHAYRDVPRPWGVFSQPIIYFFWGAGQVHPPLASLCYAVGLGVFSFFTDVLTAFRLPAAIIFTGLVLAVYFFFSARPTTEDAIPKGGEWLGALAAASLILMPRIFGHAHLAALDMPVALFWFLTVAAFRKGIQSLAWALACGFIFGLALLTKINAVLLPLALWPWGLAVYGRRSLAALLSMLILGPIIFVAGWPRLWHNTFRGIWAYLADKASRLHIPVYYLGTTYDTNTPPWHYPFVLTAVTVPALLLIAAIIGIYLACRRVRTSPTCSLILMNLITIYGVAALPITPKYDGVRLFLPAFPFIAGLAAMGLMWAYMRFGEKWRSATCVTGGVFALVLVWNIVSYHPYELSYYNALVGGLRGAHRVGFETQYWGDAFERRAWRALNTLCRKNASVCVHPLDIRVPKLLQQVGELREDLRFVAEPSSGHVLVLLAREGYFSERDWGLYRNAECGSSIIGTTARVVWQARVRGVPVCIIFEMR